MDKPITTEMFLWLDTTWRASCDFNERLIIDAIRSRLTDLACEFRAAHAALRAAKDAKKGAA